MKKTFIITAIALGFSVVTLNAETNFVDSNAIEIATKKSAVSPFCMSIVKGDIDTFKKLIDLGADVNEKSNGMTPAMYAAKFNKVEILKILVAKGAKLGAKSDDGYTVQKYAELSNAKDVLVYLEGMEF